MKPFKDKFLAKWKSDVAGPLEKEFGVKFADYAGLARGQFTVALTRNGWEGQPGQDPGFVLLLDTGDRSGQLKTNLANLKQKWTDAGKTLRSEKVRDLEFTTLTYNSDDLGKTFDKLFPDPEEGNESLGPPKKKKPGKKQEITLGQSGSLFLLATAVKDIEKILSAQSGGGVPTLSEQAAFTSSHSAQFRDALGYGWLHLKPMIDVFAKQAAEREKGEEPDPRGMGSPRLDKVFSSLGLNGLHTAAASMRDGADGCHFQLHLNVPESTRRGLFKMIAFEKKDAMPPPFVPADAVKFSRWRLDLQKSWATLESAVTEAFPPAAGALKMMLDTAGKDKDANFDLRKSLLGNLGDDILTWQKAPRKPTLEDLNSPPSLVLISSPRAEQLASAIGALAGLMPGGGKLKEREFLGRKIYSLGMPSQRGPGGRAPEKSLQYVASGGYVGFSTDAAMIEEYLRSSDSAGKALRELPGLAEATQQAGGAGNGFFGYENQAETMRSAIEILKKESGTLANLFGNSPLAGRLGMNESEKAFKDWVDFSLLPPYEKIAKYFYINLTSGSVTPEGFAFRVFAPNPPQLKK
jgi:hypothetical protein